ncbi:MAG: glutamate formimidoyltransferase, partial [Chitinophagales bacterium]|nr:glutamate formimidoyltransferase [Chitinophagales bacterium]
IQFMHKIIECVPNFSEGKDEKILAEIAAAIRSVEGVRLLDIDPGKATNRTVFTFVGDENTVVEGAFQAIKKAQELIDMRHHKGEHPRFGATDVCPFIPIANATMEDCIECAKKLGKRVGEELTIPVYLYEFAASAEHRRNLANVRAGEYEGIADKINQPEWKPDFGPAKFNEKSGNIAIGARNFLIAYNVNLNTTSEKRANSIAFDVREQGRVKMENGKKVLDEKGEPVRIPGTCKGVKGIGWFIEEFGIAQISMNITNINATPLHKAFDECVNSAHRRGMRVTGSELVGLVPLQSMLDAGKYFLQKQERSIGVSESELIKIAIKSLGLNDVKPFDPKKNIIEYVLAETMPQDKLIPMSLKAFADETASESPAPGGGSIAAYVGSLGIALGTMVANLSAQKKGWESQLNHFSAWAEKGQILKDQLLKLVDEDTRAFNKIMDAFSLPKSNDIEKAHRKSAIQAATVYAIEIPLKVMKKSFEGFELIEEMAKNGNPNSASDAGVGALCARTAVYGAYLNVCINASGLDDKALAGKYIDEAKILLANANAKEIEILKVVEGKI